MTEIDLDFSGIRALFINCKLKRSPEVSNTLFSRAGGVPAIRSGWDAGCRDDFANPEYR
jgi:hypothetical protein